MRIENNVQNNFSKKNMIEISYNPYLYRIDVKDCSLEVKGSQLDKIIKNRNDRDPFHLRIKELLEKIGDFFNSKEFSIKFNGRKEEYEDLENECYKLKNEGYNINLKANKIIQENKNILKELEDYIKKLRESAPQELKEELEKKEILKNFSESKSKESYIAVIANMSSGKSTLINAILGEDLLPAKNEACTAAIYKIKDIDNQDKFRMKVESEDEALNTDWQEVDRNLLEEINTEANDKIINIYMEGDIKGISSDEMNLVLVDTPGTNNSRNKKHKEITEGYIQNTRDNPLIIYILDVTHKATVDDENLLKDISDIINKSGEKKQLEERFIFILNKIDQINPKKESYEKIIEDTKKYLNEHGIKNPILFPVSGYFAKLLKMKKQGIELDDFEEGDLSHLQRKFLPNKGIDTIKYCSLKEREKEELYLEAEQDEYKKCLNYSGITAIEKYISNYTLKYSKADKIHKCVKLLIEILDLNNTKIKLLKSKNDIELKSLKKNLEEVENTLNKFNSNENNGNNRNELLKKIENITIEHETFNNFLIEVENLLEKAGDSLKGEVEAETAKKMIEKTLKDIEKYLRDFGNKFNLDVQEMIHKKIEECMEIIKKSFGNILKQNKITVDLEDIMKDIFKMEFNSIEDSLKNFETTKKEEITKRFVGYKKATWNPLTWHRFFIKEPEYEPVYENKKYINMEGVRIELRKSREKINEQVNEAESMVNNSLEIIKENTYEQVAEKIKDMNEEIKKFKGNIDEKLNKNNNYLSEMEKMKKIREKLYNILGI